MCLLVIYLPSFKSALLCFAFFYEGWDSGNPLSALAAASLLDLTAEDSKGSLDACGRNKGHAVSRFGAWDCQDHLSNVCFHSGNGIG